MLDALDREFGPRPLRPGDLVWNKHAQCHHEVVGVWGREVSVAARNIHRAVHVNFDNLVLDERELL